MKMSNYMIVNKDTNEVVRKIQRKTDEHARNALNTYIQILKVQRKPIPNLVLMKKQLAKFVE